MEHFSNQLVHGTKIHFDKIICQIIQAERFLAGFSQGGAIGNSLAEL